MVFESRIMDIARRDGYSPLRQLRSCHIHLNPSKA